MQNTYRIVVADDEEYIRELLAKKINEADGGFFVVGTAENGIEALKLAEELRPDILIMDICMPMLGGLDLIRKIQKLDKGMKTVIISGYDDFSYAKQALTLGVKEYLLKPFMPDEVFQVLHKISEELEHQEMLYQNIEEMQQKIDTSQKLYRERFVRKLLESRITDETAGEAAAAGIRLSFPYYAVGILRVTDAPLDKNKFRDLLEIVNDEYFSSHIVTYPCYLDEKQLIVLFGGDYRNPKTFYRDMEQGIRLISESMERYYNVKVYCALGRICDDWRFITGSYQDALAVNKGILNPATILMNYEDEMQRTGDHQAILERIKKLEDALILNIQMGKEEKALEWLREMMSAYELLDISYSEYINVSLIKIVFDISGSLKKTDDTEKIWQDEDVVTYLRNNYSNGNLLDAQAVMEQFVSRCCRRFSAVNERQGDKIVFNLKKLIDKNLNNEDFSLESASAQLCFSHNYVRQIFKQITGESFMEYLIAKRMKRACELLGNPAYKIQEVALNTGYSNQRYFASCFKKYYGCTPTEYRNRTGGANHG